MNCVLWKCAEDYTNEHLSGCNSANWQPARADDASDGEDIGDYELPIPSKKSQREEHPAKKQKTEEDTCDFGEMWKDAEPILSLLSNRRTFTLAHHDFEPEPVLHFGQSPTGNLIGILFASGWTCG